MSEEKQVLNSKFRVLLEHLCQPKGDLMLRNLIPVVVLLSLTAPLASAATIRDFVILDASTLSPIVTLPAAYFGASTLSGTFSVDIDTVPTIAYTSADLPAVDIMFAGTHFESGWITDYQNFREGLFTFSQYDLNMYNPDHGTFSLAFFELRGTFAGGEIVAWNDFIPLGNAIAVDPVLAPELGTPLALLSGLGLLGLAQLRRRARRVPSDVATPRCA